MQNGDQALLGIILAGRCLLVKMLITPELHHIFGSDFAYLYILFKLAGIMAKKRKNYEQKLLVKPGVSPLCTIGLQESLLYHSAITRCIQH